MPLPINEIFGPTIQGEGENIGTVCHFIRLSGCDNNCEWCDTKYANQITEKLTEQQVVNRIGSGHVVITGGNPCIHDLEKLLGLLTKKGITTEIETQGTACPEWLSLADVINVSPKPPSSGNQTNIPKLAPFVKMGARLKVVVFDWDDLEYADKVHKRFPNAPFTYQVGTADDDTLIENYRDLVELVATRGDRVRILPQLHRIIWGDKTGV